MMNQIEKMAALSSKEFEIAFMEEMIRHHGQAIREAEKCLERTYHPEAAGALPGHHRGAERRN